MAPSPAASVDKERNGDEDEDDYLSMTFTDPNISSSTKRESLVELKKRKAREAEARARPKSKAELAVEAASKRDVGLSTNLLSTNGDTATKANTSKGAKMMAKLGYKPGMALGATGERGLLEPVGVEMKEGRGGVGADNEKKRKIREEFERVEGEEKRRKVDAVEYMERQARVREEKRVEGLVWGAMKVGEGLEEGDREGDEGVGGKKGKRKALKDINVLWRELVKERAVAERDKRMRYDLHQSLSRRPEYDDPDEDADDRIALGKKDNVEEVELDLDDEDEELDTFEALPAAEKLEKLVAYLREKWQYCFWCKFGYPDEAMEGCPGTTEDEHG